MGKNIVVCCDGTGNEVQGDFSNVLKLFRMTRKGSGQQVYYHPGVGTISTDDAWSRWKTRANAVFGLATGYGLDEEIAGAYRFLCQHWERGDKIFLFGFSRGAYTARAVAGFVHVVGLLAPDQLNLINYALTAYKRSSESNDLSIGWNFGRATATRFATIEFLGVWDTVASVIVPRKDRLLPTLLTLPHTRTNRNVRVFRHAMSIDERRRMFRLNRWPSRQPYVSNPFAAKVVPIDQDIRQVWFAGVHSDIGGGYPEGESGLAKFPLAWMTSEAEKFGLQINPGMKDQLVYGKQKKVSKQTYVAPDAAAKLHDSMTPAWRILEWIPKAAKWREWKERRALFGWYLPWSEPRELDAAAERPLIHRSAVERREKVPGYAPVNWPDSFDICED